MTGASGFMLRNFAPISLAKSGTDNITEMNPGLKKPLEYCQELKTELDSRGTQFFSGSNAGPLDASIFGVMAVFAPGGDNTMPFLDEAL
jgi:hypothetical protein